MLYELDTIYVLNLKGAKVKVSHVLFISKYVFYTSVPPRNKCLIYTYTGVYRQISCSVT